MDNVCVSVLPTHICRYIFGCMYRTSPPRGRTYTQGPAQASACTCAHARAHRRCRRAQPPAAPKPRRSVSAVVRAAGPGAAHTENNEVTRAVFHAPMSALNADAPTNACAPTPHAVHADGQGLARYRVSGSGRARSTSPPTRAHTADPSPSHTGTRIHNIGRFSHIQING